MQAAGKAVSDGPCPRQGHPAAACAASRAVDQETASDAAATVTDGARSAGRDVKDQARESGQQVQLTASSN